MGVNFAAGVNNSKYAENIGNIWQKYFENKEKEIKEQKEKEEKAAAEETKFNRELEAKAALSQWDNVQAGKSNPMYDYLSAVEGGMNAPSGTVVAGRQLGAVGRQDRTDMSAAAAPFSAYRNGDVYTVPKPKEISELDLAKINYYNAQKNKTAANDNQRMISYYEKDNKDRMTRVNNLDKIMKDPIAPTELKAKAQKIKDEETHYINENNAKLNGYLGRKNYVAPPEPEKPPREPRKPGFITAAALSLLGFLNKKEKEAEAPEKKYRIAQDEFGNMAKIYDDGTIEEIKDEYYL